MDQMKRHYFQSPDSSVIILDQDPVRGLASFIKSNWDTEHFGFNVGNIPYLIIGGNDFSENYEIAGLLLEKVREYCIHERIRFLYVRESCQNLAAIHALEKKGFRFIEDIVYYKYELAPCSHTDGVEHPVRFYKKGDLGYLTQIAKTSFRANRFHRDPWIRREQAEDLYEKWVKETCTNNPGGVTVVEVNGEPAGFVIHEIKDLKKYFGKRVMLWRLTAISEDQTGRGVANSLCLGTLNLMKNQADIAYTGTAPTNVPAVRLATRLGFRYISSFLTFHKWL